MAVMYHYVRPDSGGMPWFRYLSLADFRKQLDLFEARYGFVTPDAFEAALASGRPADGVVLTFDDALKDHHAHVLPELKARGLWGIFYVPTGAYETGGMLDVHRIHVLIGTIGGAAALAALKPLVTPEMIPDEKVVEFRTATYARQQNDEATTAVKRILNYYIAYEHRTAVLDRLMISVFGAPHPGAEAFYVTASEMAEMAEAGMVIGSHSVHHPVFSKLSGAAQAEQIERSFAWLDPVLPAPRLKTFCYPYGGFHSFTDETERLLTEAGCRFSFNVEQREIEARDLVERPQALPRFDCNEFEFGAASMG